MRRRRREGLQEKCRYNREQDVRLTWRVDGTHRLQLFQPPEVFGFMVAAVVDRPPEYFPLVISERGLACLLVPRATIGSQPLQHVEMTAFTYCGACVYVPWTAVRWVSKIPPCCHATHDLSPTAASPDHHSGPRSNTPARPICNPLSSPFQQFQIAMFCDIFSEFSV